MRKKQKHFSRLLFGLLGLFLIGITFGSCEAEREFASNNEKINLRKISFDEFKSKNIIFDKFKQSTSFREPTSEMQRIIYDEKYDVWYDTDNIISIEKEGYISYTIPLIKQPNDSLIKNLVIYEKENEPIKVKMMQYALTDEDINRMHNGEYVDVKSKTTSQTYVANSSWSTSWYNDSGCLVTATTTIIAGSMCAAGTHTYGEECSLAGLPGGATPGRVVVKYTYAFCPSDSSTGGGPATPPSDPGGGSTGDGSNPFAGVTTPVNNEAEDDVITTPIIPGLDTKLSPCQELIKLSSPIINKSKFITLNTKTTSTIEFGFAFKKNNSTGTYLNPDIIPNDPNNPDHLLVANYIGGNYIGISHTHPDPEISGIVPMFSAKDIQTLLRIANNHNNNGRPKNYAEYIVTLTVRNINGGNETFAIKIKDFLAFSNAINTEDKFKKFKRKLERRYDKSTHSASLTDLSKDLLEVFKEVGSDNGIGLYKASANFTSWDEIVIDTDPSSLNYNQPINKPCK